jgi:transposase
VKKAASQQGNQSRRTAYKWLERYKETGEAALENRNSRPQRSPRWLAVK